MKNLGETETAINSYSNIKRHKPLIFLVSVISIAIMVGVGLGMFMKIRPTTKRHFRLPTNLVPKHYNLEVQPYFVPDDFKFVGNVEIVFDCVNETDEVILHVKDLEIDEENINLRDDTGNQIEILTVEYDVRNSFIVILVSQNLHRNNKYRLFMKFESKFSDKLDGFYISKYADKNNITHYTAVTKFEPISARKAFPCFDEPAMKATFDVTLVRWQNMTSLSNMPKIKTELRGGDWEADVFETSMKMSTYLVAYFIGDYKGKKKDKITVWAPPDNISSIDFALEVGANFLSFYEQLFKVPYEAPKLDMISIKQFSPGAMENWGLITYAERALLYDEDDNENYFLRRRITKIVAHEIAHQWFGNLVTMKWWGDLWLNEGMTTYMSSVALKALYPEYTKIDPGIATFHTLSAFDCSHNALPLAKNINSVEQLLDDRHIFDPVSTYDKGRMITRMVHHILGNNIFWSGISKYLKGNAYGNVEESTLWDNLTNAQPDNDHRLNLSEVMRPWTNLRGHPIVSVIRNYTDRTALLTQFSCKRTLPEEHESDLWNIPIFYITARQNSPTIETWLVNRNATLKNLPSESRWILINPSGFAYYGVYYDKRNWKLLARQLQINHLRFTTDQRCHLLYDMCNSIRMNFTEAVVLLEFYLYVIYEEDFSVLMYSDCNPLIFKYSQILLHDKYESLWNEYIKYIYVPIFERYGAELNDTDTDFAISFSVYKLLSDIKYVGYINEALKIYQSWKERNETNVKKASMIIPLCIGIKYGTTDDWEEMHKLFLKENDRGFQVALACTTNKALIRRLLKRVLEKERFMFNWMAKEVLRNNEMWSEFFNFLDENFNVLIKDEASFKDMQRLLFSNIENPFMISKLIAVLEKHTKEMNKKMEEVVNEMINSYNDKISVVNRDLKLITTWLKRKSWTKKIH